MSTIVKVENTLVVPASVQRRAGIKSGDRVMFTVAPRTITITSAPVRTYKPTKGELAAIRKGEAAMARGEYVSLTEFLATSESLHDLERPRRKSGAKAARKISR
jgi:bifunctional DNA-binding transcriptional regulator/antitoxin component of YhaV-PrlF toxin-antitoxin module